MRAKVKTARLKASKLHGATAGYVSLVDRGANETPFKMIKSTEGAGAMSIMKRTKVAASHKKVETGKKAEAKPVTKTVMAKMVFDQAVFEDESDVRDWIEKAEWDADSVSITDDGQGSYVARPEGTTDDSFTRLAKVDAESDGVEAFVGEMIVKAEADPGDEDDGDEEEEGDEEEIEAKGMKGKKPMKAEDEEDMDDADAKGKKKPYKKAEETPAPVKLSKRAEFLNKAKSKIVKFNGWDAFYSKKSTLAESLKAGMSWDATPPGFYDVQAAFNGAVQAILGDEAEGVDKGALLQKAAADYADILTGLDSFFDGYINAGEETVAKAFESGDTAEKIAKWAEGYAQFVAGGADAPVVETKGKEAVKKTADPVAIDYNKVADLIAKAVAPVVEQVEQTSATVTKMAERRQTKKSADLADGGSADAPVTEKKAEELNDWLRRKQQKGMIG